MLRSFVDELIVRGFQPKIYCSDGDKLVNCNHVSYVAVHDKYWVRFLFAIIRRVFPDLTWLPDYQWYSWGKQTIRHINRNNDLTKYDYIHSVSFPNSSHKVALKIKEKTGIPWIAQFYDPWADNPYRPFKTKFLKRLDYKQEREIVENADLIIHDNEAIANIWCERYGTELAKKIVVLPLSIDPVTPKNTEEREKDTIVISHIGNFMLNRTSEVFIQAVSNLFEHNPELKSALRVNYVGEVTQKEKDFIKKNNLEDNFYIAGSVSPEECQYYYENSDIFLAIDGVNNVNLFFPSKILKYFCYQKPILGITPKDSVLDFEMRNSHNESLRNDDANGIENYLYRAITNYEGILHNEKDYWKRFTPQSVVKEYENLLKKLL